MARTGGRGMDRNLGGGSGKIQVESRRGCGTGLVERWMG